MSETKTFGNLVLSKPVLSAIQEMGFEEPSPIQSQTIPLVLEGQDVIGQAQTGTGKTAAFGIPLAEKLVPGKREVQALVLTPTRELAIQVAEEVNRIARFKGLKTLPVYGGQAIERQIRALGYGVHIVIGTPGRVIDHLNRGTLKLDGLKVLVLDEADEMLNMGFIEDIEAILRYVPENRQTLLFSATMPDPIRRIAEKYMKDPVTVTVSKENLAVPTIEQVYYEVPAQGKLNGLCRVLDMENVNLAILFTRTKKGADELAEALQGRGYSAEVIHGDLSQAQRDRVMKKFREGQVELLVATDVAARGLDIENVSHVINYDIPQDSESYVHRIGRTGRAGRSGVAITFITPREYKQLKTIEHDARVKIKRRPLPSLEDLSEKQREFYRSKLINLVKTGNLGRYKPLIEELSEEHDPVDLAAAALLIVSREEDAVDLSASEFKNTGAEEGMVRFFLNIGRQQGVRPQDIVRTIAEEAGIPGRIIGRIDIFDRFTFVEVPEEVATRVREVMQENTIRGQKINIEPARRK